MRCDAVLCSIPVDFSSGITIGDASSVTDISHKCVMSSGSGSGGRSGSWRRRRNSSTSSRRRGSTFCTAPQNAGRCLSSKSSCLRNFEDNLKV